MIEFIFTVIIKLVKSCLRGVVANMLNCDIVVNEFKFESRYYVHFSTYTFVKGKNPLIPNDRLYSTTTVILQEYFNIKRPTNVDMPFNKKKTSNL